VLPKYQRPQRGSIVDEVEPRIRELLQAFPRMPATVIAERIGWTRSIRVLSARVAELRPVYLQPDPAPGTAYAAGEIAQCDLWGVVVGIQAHVMLARQPQRGIPAEAAKVLRRRRISTARSMSEPDVVIRCLDD
jgi:transposase